MRRSFLAAIALLIPAASAVNAQGRIIVPCLRQQPAFSPESSRPCPASAVSRLSSNAIVDVDGKLSRTTVTEIFENKGHALGEADFLFPLPIGAALEGVQLEIDGELVDGEVMDAGKARSTYERIVREQRDPALIEWAGNGLLRARVFPFGAGERRTLVIRYRQVVALDGRAIRITGRLTGSGESSDELASGGFRIRYSPGEFGLPWSPTHNVQTGSLRAGKQEISLSGKGNDVLAYLPLKSTSNTPAVTVLSHSDRQGEKHAMIIISPPEITTDIMPRDISLAIDVSGSMSGQKMKQAIDAGHAVLKSLGKNDRFRLISFSDDIDVSSAEYEPVSEQSLKRAGKWLDNLSARGGTNIGAAMKSALNSKRTSKYADKSSRLQLVLLITDGQPTVGMRAAAIQDSTSAWLGNARVFTFGVGSDVDAGLVEQLALQGRGAAQFVRPEESVERAVSLTAQRLSSPIVSDVEVSVNGARLHNIYTPNGKDLMAGRELIFIARYQGPNVSNVKISGNSNGKPYSSSSPIRVSRSDSINSFIPRLWAVQRVAALDTERRKNGASKEIDDEIRALGEKYGIPTPFTSVLVLEPQQSRPAAFEAAKRTSEQRKAVTMSAAVEMMAADIAAAPSAVPTKVAGGLILEQKNGVWTDRRLSNNSSNALTTLRIRAFGPAWMEIARTIPELKEVMSVGESIRIRVGSAILEIAPDAPENTSKSSIDRFIELSRLPSGSESR